MDRDLLSRYQHENFSLDDLTDADGKELVSISSTTINDYICKGKKTGAVICNGRFEKHAGVFVTIKRSGDLRGCIGFPYPVHTMCNAVINASVAAATEDPRFQPIRKEELPDITVEVTVLGFPEEIDQLSSSALKSIEIGKHGLIVQLGYFSGLLLPQVAEEENFTVSEFLEAACLKAGLSPSAWEDRETKVYKFEGRVFE